MHLSSEKMGLLTRSGWRFICGIFQHYNQIYRMQCLVSFSFGTAWQLRDFATER